MLSFIETLIGLIIGKLIYKYLLEDRVNELLNSIHEYFQQKKEHEELNKIAENNRK